MPRSMSSAPAMQVSLHPVPLESYPKSSCFHLRIHRSDTHSLHPASRSGPCMQRRACGSLPRTSRHACVFLYPLESIMGTTIRTKAEAIVTELAFIDGNQDLAYRLLEEAVYHVGYTELTLLSIILGYLYPTNRTWSVFTRHDTG